MKFYDVALAGVLIAIFGFVGGAYADTIIASKQYVDSRLADVDVSAAVDNGTGSNTALQLESSGTVAPSTRAVKAAADDAEVVSRNTTTSSADYNQLTVTAGTKTDDNHFLTSLTHKNDMDTVKGAINAMATAATPTTDDTIGTAVVAVTQKNGVVTVKKGDLNYGDAMNSVLKDTNDVSANATCSAANPCVLTYAGASIGYRWTNLNSEGLSVNTAQ